MPSARQMPGEPSELDALYALAVGEHRAGRLSEAAALYRKILALEPNLAEVQNNLGIVLCQQGRLDEALPRLERAVALNPRLADAYNNLGNVLREQGKLDEAVARYRKAVAIKPDFAEAHNNLGNVLREQGQLDLAAARFERALAIRPDYAEGHNNLGNILREQGKPDEARARFEQALALNPRYPEAYYNLGMLLWHQGQHDEARQRFEQAIALQPAYAEAHNNLGNILWDQGELEPAAARFEQAIAERPDYPDAHNNLGITLWHQGKLDEAQARLQQAIALWPDYAEAHSNLGIVLWHQGNIEGARAQYQQALALRPDNPDAQRALASCYLVTEDYERGWPAYESRLRLPGVNLDPSLPRWTGQPLAGRRLLLLAEQGLGDTLQFVRYAHTLKAMGARTVLLAPPALGRLLESHPDVDELIVIGSAENLPAFDYYLPLLSAPCVLGTTQATIPHEIPYLWADPELRERWGQELSRIEGFKIGIAWQGSREFRGDRWRSFALAQLAPLAGLPGVRLISLQKGFGSEQIAQVDFPVLDLSDRLDTAAGPFMDTAAVIANIDLVITADTAIGHLAAALGAPVFLALETAADWRWLRDRDDSPWYPTTRLFRQSVYGQWPDVFQRMADAVRARQAIPRSQPQQLDLRPSLVEAYYHSGKSLWQKGRLDEAAARYQKGLTLDPENSVAHNDLAIVLSHGGKLEPAVEHFEKAIAIAPDYAEAYNNLGNILWQQGKTVEATARMRQAATLRPDFSEAHNNLGSALAQQDQLDEAAQHFQQAIELAPGNAQAHYNLGKVLLNLDRLDEALARFQQAVALRPDIADMQYAVATCHLLAEDYQRGWPLFEWRLRLPGAGTQPDLPRWKGELLEGRTLLLLAEGGLGDTLQFIRYVRLFKARGARVVLAVQPALGPLLRSYPEVDELVLIDDRGEVPPCDFYLRLLSSPGMLETRAETIPREIPYLQSDAELTEHWRRELAGIEGLRIGIVWQGSRGFIGDRWRSIALGHFAPLAGVSGVRLVSLQKGFGSEQMAQVDFPVVDLGDRLDEKTGAFVDTAAVIRNLDLVVTPDTAIGHLAGALGAPVWLALPVASDWRWRHHRDDTPWYPTMRLFRQREFGQWPDVFQRMAEALGNREMTPTRRDRNG